jgi:hypothetical protein
MLRPRPKQRTCSPTTAPSWRMTMRSAEGLDLDRPADGARGDRVLVVVKANEAGLDAARPLRAGDRGGDGVEAIEASGNRHQVRPLCFEHLPDRLIGDLGMLVRLGVGDAAVEQQPVQLFVAAHPQPRREEALAHQPDLVLDLPLFPTGGRRARHRLDQIMAAHPQKTAVELALLADKHRLYRRLHIVVDTARAGSLEQGERPIVSVEHHFLRLARIGTHEQHPAVAEPDVRHLHCHRHTAELRRSRGSSRTGTPRPAQSSAAHTLAPSSPRAPGASFWRSAGPRHSSPHSQAGAGLQKSGSASAVPVASSTRSPAIRARASRARGRSSATVACPAHSEIPSPPSGSPCAQPSAIPEARGRSP